MKREEIIEELKKFSVVPHNEININNLTDKQLELRLKLFRNMSEEADRFLKD